MDLKAPDIIIRNEKRMLQESLMLYSIMAEEAE